MSFARNFALGQQIAKTATDAYDSARQQKEFADIQNARPEESQGYTAADGAQMEAMARAINPETGKPYYEIQDNGAGGLQARNNFAYAGSDGQMVEPGSTTGMEPRRVADFLGQRYDADQLTPERMEGLRGRAMAGAVSKTDPIRGLGLMQALKSGEREDERFGFERQAQPLKQRTLELGVARDERGERQGVRADDVQSFEDSAMKMPEAEVRTALSEYLNTNKSDLPLLVMGSTKDGFMMAERDPKTGDIGKSFQVPLAVGRKLVVGRQLADKGMGKEAMAYLSGVDDNITSIVDKYNRQNLEVAKSNNDANYRSGILGNQRTDLGIKAANAKFTRDRLTRQDQQTQAATDFQGKVDGVLEGYQAAMNGNNPKAAAIYAREYDQLRATAPKGLRVPSLSSLNDAQKAPKDDKPVEVKEEGGKVTIGGKLMFNDGQGGYIPAGPSGKPAGVMPSQREAALKAAGVPDNAVESLEWNKDGTAVVLNGTMRFGLNELKDISKEVARINRNTAFAEEDARSSMGMHSALRRQRDMRAAPPEPSDSGFGPRITNRPDPYAPSIYADPEEWTAYRQFQNTPR